ncbi:hypothetical protein CBL_03166 [Carabus blaptoides fortunei]
MNARDESAQFRQGNLLETFLSRPVLNKAFTSGRTIRPREQQSGTYEGITVAENATICSNQTSDALHFPDIYTHTQSSSSSTLTRRRGGRSGAEVNRLYRKLDTSGVRIQQKPIFPILAFNEYEWVDKAEEEKVEVDIVEQAEFCLCGRHYVAGLATIIQKHTNAHFQNWETLRVDDDAGACSGATRPFDELHLSVACSTPAPLT